jgi:hypothetical protein
LSAAVTEQWLDQVFDGGTAPGPKGPEVATVTGVTLPQGTVQLVVGVAKEATVSVVVGVSAQGVAASLGSTKTADLTLTISSADFDELVSGRLDPSVAFMQGRLKTAGDNLLLLRLLRWTATATFEQGRRRAQASQ